MKVRLIWTAILGMIVVVIIGCGSNDSPIKEEMLDEEETSKLPTEPPDPYIVPILGTWHLQWVTAFEDGVQRQRLDAGSYLFTLIFKPNKTFEFIYRFPIEEWADLDFLKSKGLEHI